MLIPVIDPEEAGQPAQAALQSTAIREQGTLVHFTRLVLTPGPNLPQKDLHMLTAACAKGILVLPMEE